MDYNLSCKTQDNLSLLMLELTNKQCIICRELSSISLLCEMCYDTLCSFSNCTAFYGKHKCTEVFICYQCNKTFVCTTHLEEHNAKHSDIETFALDVIHNSSISNAIKQPLLNQKKYHCDLCNKSFPFKYILEDHFFVYHADEKPYVCVYCSKRFRHSVNLRKHTRRHTGEKPYHCINCGKSFFQKQSLDKHNKRKTSCV